MRKIVFIFLILCAFISVRAQNNADTVMILPFENTSGKPEFNWVGESFADSLADLFASKEVNPTGLNVVTNEERKIIQQGLKIPLTALPSLATSVKLAQRGKASLLIAGKYNIVPAQGDAAAKLTVNVRTIRVNEGRFLSEEFSDGSRKMREIVLEDALANLQTVEGQIAYLIMLQRDKTGLAIAQNKVVELANKVSSRAFEAYIKGLLTPESDLQSRENYFKNAMRIYSEDEKTKGGTYADAALELGHFYLNQRQNQKAIDYFSQVSNEIQKCREEAEKKP